MSNMAYWLPDTYETAIKRAGKGKRFFNRYGWVESCRLKRLQEIPKVDFEILKKYVIKM